MIFTINTLISCKKKQLCLRNSYLNYLNNSIYTMEINILWAVSSVGRAIPF